MPHDTGGISDVLRTVWTESAMLKANSSGAEKRKQIDETSDAATIESDRSQVE